MSLLFDLLIALLALAGLAAIALAALLARPLKPPPLLRSVLDGALPIDAGGLPELSRFQARDGTWLAYRRYPGASGAGDRIALLAHGSAGASAQMNAIARGLANAGIAAVAVDFRPLIVFWALALTLSVKPAIAFAIRRPPLTASPAPHAARSRRSFRPEGRGCRGPPGRGRLGRRGWA